jgi:hypothetical protein
MSDQRIENFTAFWPYYLSEHANVYCRICHFIGTALALGIVVWSVLSGNYLSGLWALLAGYGFAWIGHYLIEKNRPATFTYPLWSLIADFKLFGFMLRGKGWAATPVHGQMGISETAEASQTA